MDDRGISTTLDALLFLVLVSACAVILSPVLGSYAVEHASADRSLRELEAGTLVALETEKVDYFEYRILGDVADRIAEAGGVNATSDYLYKEVSATLLGRGSRHKTVTDLAAEGAACQFWLQQGDMRLRLNPLTSEYDENIQGLLDKSVRSRLDNRYGYEFRLRWVPFTDVPLEGDVSCGKPHPVGAVSVQTFITVPYTTNVTLAYLQVANRDDLEAINHSLSLYRSDEDLPKLEGSVRQALLRCLRNTTRAEVREIWGNTLGSSRAVDKRIDPALVLEGFSTNSRLNSTLTGEASTAGEDLILGTVEQYNSVELDALTSDIVAQAASEDPDFEEIRHTILVWLLSRYEPSRARVSLYVWVGP